MKAVVFRLPPVYGYGPHTEIFRSGKPIKTGFQVFIENAMAGTPIEVWGDCGKGRDIIYVKDVTEAFLCALKTADADGLFNIASGRLTTLRDEVEMIIKVFCEGEQKSEIIYRPDRANSIEWFLYDNSKARKHLGWVPQYSLEDMMLDYKREMKSGRFSFLVEKRRRLLEKE